MIHKCNCKHKEQDRMHGQGNRIMNRTGKLQRNDEARCTVCSTIHRIGTVSKNTNVSLKTKKEDKNDIR